MTANCNSLFGLAEVFAVYWTVLVLYVLRQRSSSAVWVWCKSYIALTLIYIAPRCQNP